MSEEKELPAGWVRTILEDVTIPIRVSVQPQEVSTLRYIGLEHIEAETMRLIGTAPANELKSNASRFGPEDVLYGRLRPYLNKVFRPDFEGVCSPEFLVFRESPYLNSRYLQYFLNSWRFKTFAAHLVEGDRPRVDWGQLKCFNFPFPPIREQQRIVSAIEERFTILDAVTTALQQDKQKLKLARASVLKYAVEGKLTEKWRAEHPATESGSELLERILAERRARWEAEQLAKGKDPRKLRYEEPKGPDVSELSELPEGWCWATVEQVSYFVRYGTSAKTSEDPSGVPVLRMGNIQDGQLDISNLKYLPVDHPEFPDLLLQEGDLLFNRTNSAELVGKSAVYRGKVDQCSYASYLICVRTVTECLTDYVCFFLNSLYGKAWVASVVTQQVGQANVNGTKLQNLVFPLPPLAEQQQIVADVERRLSVIEQAEAAIETSLKRIERARQSILERAFSGRLVLQDPDDEPASVLLERIQEERTRRAMEGKPRGRNRGVKAARGKKMKEQDFVPQWQLLRDAQPSGSVDGSLSNAGAHEDDAAEKSEVGLDKMDKEELEDLVQMPLLSLWD